MFPQALSQVCATVGVVLLPLVLGVIRTYKTRVRKHVNDAFSKLLNSKEIVRFITKVEQKKVTYEMISDFYQQFSDANWPNLILGVAWKSLGFSGVLFILSSISGCIDYFLADFIAYQSLGVGIFFLIFGMYFLLKLESKL